jgi:hypothetical protein
VRGFVARTSTESHNTKTRILVRNQQRGLGRRAALLGTNRPLMVLNVSTGRAPHCKDQYRSLRAHRHSSIRTQHCLSYGSADLHPGLSSGDTMLRIYALLYIEVKAAVLSSTGTAPARYVLKGRAERASERVIEH